MACANVALTIAAIVVLALAVWPGLLGAGTAFYALVGAALLVLVVAWTGVDCRYCKKLKPK